MNSAVETLCKKSGGWMMRAGYHVRIVTGARGNKERVDGLHGTASHALQTIEVQRRSIESTGINPQQSQHGERQHAERQHVRV